MSTSINLRLPILLLFLLAGWPPAAALAMQVGSSEPAAGAVHLGNGVRNGWADSDSIQIWTRTTLWPEMNWEGREFVIPQRPQLRELIQSRDAALQLKSQLPEGATLDQMEAACPGTAGRVRLVYWPLDSEQSEGAAQWPPVIPEPPADAQQTDAITTAAESDFTAQWTLTELLPGTTYGVRVEAVPLDHDNFMQATVYPASFRTAPAADDRNGVRFCMTTCHDFPRRDADRQGHLIYKSMPELKPDFTVHAGDVEYYDQAYPFGLTIDLMRFHWQRLFALPLNRAFYSHHTTYFMKDDHDTLKNDCWPGQRYGSVTFEQGRDLFNLEQFPANDLPYKTVRWGADLQIWLLDGRDFRSPNNQPDGPEKSILGETQKKWLLDSLSRSTATFKIVFSPTPIVGPDRGGKRDNHANQNFEHEGNQLREFLANLDNAIVLCGDRHWQYATESTDHLWEFGCGPGSTKHQLGWNPRDRRDEHRFLRVAGGFLSGEIQYGDDQLPVLMLRHHAIDGSLVNETRLVPESTPSNR